MLNTERRGLKVVDQVCLPTAGDVWGERLLSTYFCVLF